MGQLGATIGGAVIGAVIGSAIPGVGTVLGAQIGAALGGAVYSILNPPKNEGPRLTDRKMQTAEYGGGITWGRGLFRTAGTVIWQTDLQEHEHGGGGKGGGGGQTTYSYSASFAILLCEGPIRGIKRIWADNKVVWQGGDASSELPFVLYLGNATQNPDPTMQADPDITNVPDYRGYAYIVFTDMDLSDYFNRIPNLEFEIECNGESTFQRLGPEWVPNGDNTSFVGYTNIPLDGAYLDGGQIVSCVYTAAAAPTSTYQEFRYNLWTGELEQTGALLDVLNPNDSSSNSFIEAQNCNIAFGRQRGAGTGPDVSKWYVAGERMLDFVSPPVGADEYSAVAGRPYKQGAFVYAPGGPAATGTGYIAKWAYANGIVEGDADADYFDLDAEIGSHVDAGQVAITFDDDGKLWAIVSTEDVLLKIEPSDMSLIRRIDVVDSDVLAGMALATAMSSFTVYRDLICMNDSSTQASIWTINDDDTFTKVSSVDSVRQVTGTPMLNLDGGYILTVDGVLYIGGLDTVGDCVAAISEYGHDPNTLYDVTDLPDKLRGFRIGTPMTKANAIDALRNCYFFGYAEVDGIALFRHTFHDPDVEIPEEDLAAYADGSECPPLIRWVDGSDDEIPWRIVVKFIDADGDYQPGTAIWTRDTGTSRVETTLDLPVVLTYAEAKAIADTHGARAEMERRTGTFTASRKWLKVASLDVATIGAETVRIVDTAWAMGEPVEFSCVPTKAALFDLTIGSSGTSPGGTGGGGGTTTVRALVPTESVLLDIAAVEGDAPPYGFAWAAGPKGEGRWPGAVLYKSYDGGTNYTEVARKTTPDIIGRTTDALGDYTDPLTDPDETNVVTVRLTRANAELVTVTDDALDGGANRWAIEASGNWELLQSRDADLASAQVYDLSYHLRGQFDTDPYMGDHAAGDRFVALPVDVIDAPESDLNVAIWYQAVTIGMSLSPTGWVQFTNTGNNTNSQGGGVVRHLPALIKIHTETSYTFVEADRGYWHIWNAAGAATVTLPAALKNGWNAIVCNIAADDMTLDPANDLDGDSASVALEQFQGVMLATDSTDFYTVRGKSAGSGGGGSSITVKDQGSTLTTALTSLDFLGASITAAHLGGGAVAVTVVQTIHTLNGGVTVDADADTVNFQGGITAADAGGGVTNVYLSSMAQSRIKLRASGAGTGAPVDGTPAEAAAIIAESSGDATKSLFGDGNWKVPGLVTGAIPFTWALGDGSDGSLVFDGTNAVNGASRSGTTYTLSRTVMATDIQVDSGVTVVTAGFQMYWTGTISGSGTIHNKGGNASGSTGGAAPASGFYGGSAAGVNGSVGAAFAGTASNGIGGAGGQGGSGPGGAAQVGGPVTAPANNVGGTAYAYTLHAAQSGRAANGSTVYVGGASGSPGRGDASNTGGGSGAGGGIVGLFGRYWTFTGTVSVAGGDGAQPASGNTGGGGPGGGGALFVMTATYNWQSLCTVNVGSGATAIGRGTGGTSSAASSGRIIQFILPP